MSDNSATMGAETSLPTVQGTVAEKGLDRLVLALPGTDYRLWLLLPPGVSQHLPEAGSSQRVTGTIHVRARRIDIVSKGGRFIEPVQGRPRRIQGRVLAIPSEAAAQVLAVQCAPGCVMWVTPMKPQTPADFLEGQLVSFDVEPGARFEPMHPSPKQENQ